MKKLITIILILTGFSVQSFAQNGKLSEDVQNSQAILGNLDSLMNLWYVKTSTPAKVKRTQNTHGFRPDEVPYYSDSVYSYRIGKIQSPLPYTYNSKVKGFIDLYAVRKRQQVERMLGLSEFYFPIFEEILDKYNMPQELKYLSIVESALNTRAVSRVGATGLWQFMYGTGKLYNLNINSFIDQRKDPYKATEAAAIFLNDLHQIFGDWFLAIAAYNCGPGNVSKAIRRSGGKHTFWEIYNYLPQETRGYVPAFIAASYVFQYHQDHNLYPQQINLPTMVDTVLVTKDLAFAPIASVLDIPVDLIRDLNPQYKADFIPARGTTFTLRLPAAKAYAFTSYQDSIYAVYAASLKVQPNLEAPSNQEPVTVITKDSSGNIVSTTTITPTKPSPQVEDQPVEKVKVRYTVKAGDHLSGIAELYDVSIYSLRRWNHIKGNHVSVGQRLTVMVPADKEHYYRKINTMTAFQKKRLKKDDTQEDTRVAEKKVKVQREEKPVKQQDKTANNKQVVKYSYYTVQKGDTLWSIAQRFPGVTVDDIKRVNGIRDNHSIQIGQKIKIAHV